MPDDFFPQAKCALGAPKGPPVRKLGSWTYTREYEHASVFVDLTNRTACHVSFTGGGEDQASVCKEPFEGCEIAERATEPFQWQSSCSAHELGSFSYFV